MLASLVLVAACTLIAACNFQHGALSITGDGPPGGTSDADTDAASDGPSDVRSAAFCDAADPTLAGCWELENTTADGTANQMDATATGATYVTGRTGMAVHIDAGTALDVAENMAMDIPAMTVEAWIRAAIPTSGRSGILDNDGQYSLYLYPGPILRCTGFEVSVTLAENVWTHVACTYDDATGIRRVFVNGSKVGETTTAGGPLPMTATNGLTLGGDGPAGNGDPLLGDLDQVRLYSVALSPAQICADAEQTLCP